MKIIICSLNPFFIRARFQSVDGSVTFISDARLNPFFIRARFQRPAPPAIKAFGGRS